MHLMLMRKEKLLKDKYLLYNFTMITLNGDHYVFMSEASK